MYYKYDDYDYYTEHEEKVSEQEKQEVLEEIANEDFLIKLKQCA